MRPGARIGAVIEILGELAEATGPAERVVAAYTRNRRYIGSKDRRAIGNLVYGVLRARLRLDWWLARFGYVERSARMEILAYLQLSEKLSSQEIAALFDGEGYAPVPLTKSEEAWLAALTGEELNHPEQPDWVGNEVFAWLHEKLARRFGEDLTAEMSALRREAEVVLRVNSIKGSRQIALDALAQEGIETHETALSPLGLRVEGRRALQATQAFRDGLVDVQDEGSQLIAVLCDAQPGMAVADLCAGAGGKTLALAAAMQNQGRLAALDVEAARLQRAQPRFVRAGATMVKPQTLPDPDWLAASAGTFDRVLVDAPCSGSGVWRRQPDARLALTPERLVGYRRMQREVLQTAADLVKPGGRLIYATCSLLEEENEAQVEAFLQRHTEFAQLPIGNVWGALLPEVNCPAEGPHLLLTPRRHGTDGFFVSVLERRAEA